MTRPKSVQTRRRQANRAKVIMLKRHLIEPYLRKIGIRRRKSGLGGAGVKKKRSVSRKHHRKGRRHSLGSNYHSIAQYNHGILNDGGM